MQPSESYVTTQDGVRLFVQKFGDGPHAVIIPNAVHMIESFRHLARNRTIIFFDLRNRGNSDSVSDRSRLARGIHQDVDDMEDIRQHFGIRQVDAIGHSYLGLMVILYALKYPQHVNRIVQIGASQPDASTQYPPHLTGADATLAAFLGKVARLQSESQSRDPKETSKEFWAAIRELMVANPDDADKIRWTPFDYPNEVNFMKHWVENVLPSMQAIHLGATDVSQLKAPVLAIHGTRDRQAPYGGGRDWALILPDARLLTVENAAHVPWIEAPERVFGAIETFLGGTWPEAAQKVSSLDAT